MTSDDVGNCKRLSRMLFIFTGLQVAAFLFATVAWTMLPWLGIRGRNDNKATTMMMVLLFGGWAYSAIAVLLFISPLVSTNRIRAINFCKPRVIH